MKRLFLLVAAVVAFYSAPAMTSAGIAMAASPWQKLTSTTTCQAVSSTAVTVLAANANRYRWSIWTTSGAPTIYFREGGTATPHTDSGALTGGMSYTEDYAASTKAVSAITKSSTAWVCVKEGVQE